MASKKIENLAAAYAAAKRGLDTIKEQEKVQAKETARIEADLFTALEDEGLASVGIDGLGKFRLNDLAWAKIEDRDKAIEWADQNKPELLTLNHMQLSMIARAALKGEGEMPPGISVTTSRKIGWTKA